MAGWSTSSTTPVIYLERSYTSTVHTFLFSNQEHLTSRVKAKLRFIALRLLRSLMKYESRLRLSLALGPKWIASISGIEISQSPIPRCSEFWCNRREEKRAVSGKFARKFSAKSVPAKPDAVGQDQRFVAKFFESFTHIEIYFVVSCGKDLR